MERDITLWGHWTCPFVNRVEFALGQRGIERELVSVPPSAVRPDDFELPPEFVEHSPRLEVPMMRIDGEYAVDSIPLLYWLEDRLDAPTLLPDATASLVRERVAWLDEHLMRPHFGVAYGTDEAKIARSSDRLGDALNEMDAWLDESAWLAGGAPSLAEAIAVPIYLRLPSLVDLGFAGGIPPRVTDHRDRTLALDGGRHVGWSAEQAGEYLGRHLAFRARNA
ncbi:MAG: glutathione S-transferase family protein [Actinomycetota bacterium]